jgi:hypothetical protein
MFMQVYHASNVNGEQIGRRCNLQTPVLTLQTGYVLLLIELQKV